MSGWFIVLFLSCCFRTSNNLFQILCMFFFLFLLLWNFKSEASSINGPQNLLLFLYLPCLLFLFNVLTFLRRATTCGNIFIFIFFQAPLFFLPCPSGSPFNISISIIFSLISNSTYLCFLLFFTSISSVLVCCKQTQTPISISSVLIAYYASFNLRDLIANTMSSVLRIRHT